MSIPLPPAPWVPTATDSVTKRLPDATMQAIADSAELSASIVEGAAPVADSAIAAQQRGDSRTFGVKPTENRHPTQRATSDSNVWYSAGAGTGGTAAVAFVQGGGAFGADAFRQTWTVAATAGGGGITTGRQSSGDGTIPVTAGEIVSVSIYGQPSVACTALARIVWLDAAGSSAPGSTDGPAKPLAAGEVRRFEVENATVPAGAVRAAVQLRTNTASAIGTGSLTASRPNITPGAFAGRSVSRLNTGAAPTGKVDASPVIGSPEPARVAHWGDSIAYTGTNVDSPSSLLGSEFDVAVFNGGVSGESSTQIRTRQVADAATRDWIQVLGLGHNGASGAFTPAQIVADIQACVDHLTGPRRFLVLELIPWANHDSTQRANYNAVIAGTKAAFPRNFVPIATWLRSQAAADAMGITFTSDDLTDIAAGSTPRVFRTDDIHLNLLGRKAYAYRIARELEIRGWVSKPVISTTTSSTVTEIRFPAAELSPLATGPDLGSISSTVPVWRLDAATAEYVGTVTDIPSTWLTYDLVVETANVGAGSGDYALRASYIGYTIGAAATATGGSTFTVTASAQDVPVETVLLSGITRPASGRVGFRVDRRAADAADTLANDVGVVAVRLRKAS